MDREMEKRGVDEGERERVNTLQLNVEYLRTFFAGSNFRLLVQLLLIPVWCTGSFLCSIHTQIIPPPGYLPEPSPSSVFPLSLSSSVSSFCPLAHSHFILLLILHSSFLLFLNSCFFFSLAGGVRWYKAVFSICLLYVLVTSLIYGSMSAVSIQ